jgi:signal peptide peptidase SppA
MSKRGLNRILRAATATPWAILPEKLEAIIGLLELRASGAKLSKAEIQARIGDGRRGAPASGGAVAVLPLYGVVAHRMNAMNDVSAPGGTSTEMFGQAFDKAMSDPNVAAIVIDIDSPGGSVEGVPELAAKIAAARGSKPIVAVANAMAASAAYWLAAAADEIVVTPSGLVGSIGVYQMHVDASEAVADEGLKVTYISAGKYKTEGNPHEPAVRRGARRHTGHGGRVLWDVRQGGRQVSRRQRVGRHGRVRRRACPHGEGGRGGGARGSGRHAGRDDRAGRQRATERGPRAG